MPLICFLSIKSTLDLNCSPRCETFLHSGEEVCLIAVKDSTQISQLWMQSYVQDVDSEEIIEASYFAGQRMSPT